MEGLDALEHKKASMPFFLLFKYLKISLYTIYVIKYKYKGIEFLPQTIISNPYFFVIQCRRPLIFQTMNSFRSNNDSLKHQRFTTSDCKDIGIRKSEFLAKTHFL